MARCSGSRSLRGVLSTAALLPSVLQRFDAKLPGEIAAALRPASAAALEAETQNTASSWVELWRLGWQSTLPWRCTPVKSSTYGMSCWQVWPASFCTWTLLWGGQTEAALRLHGGGGSGDDGTQPISGSGSTVDGGGPHSAACPSRAC